MGKNKYISLSVSEKKELEEGYTHGTRKHFRTRCHALLLSNAGYKSSALADLFSVRIRTIYEWFKQWDKEGISGLGIASGRGRKATLDSSSAEHESIIMSALSHNRQRLDLVCEEVGDQLGCQVSKGMMKAYLKKKDLSGNG